MIFRIKMIPMIIKNQNQTNQKNQTNHSSDNMLQSYGWILRKFMQSGWTATAKGRQTPATWQGVGKFVDFYIFFCSRK